jgi:hypothetical protein
MKTKNIFSIFFFLISISTFCQLSNNENLYKDYLLELKKQKVDTICVFEDYSIGSNKTFDDTVTDFCIYDSNYYPTYIFWKQNDKTLFTIKDNCFEYSVIEIDAEKVWKKYFENKKLINAEQVKNFQFIEINKRKKRILNTMIDHSHHQNFRIIINNQIVEKRFDDFDLQKSDDNEQININYKHNINLQSKILVDLISNLILSNESLLTKSKKN